MATEAVEGMGKRNRGGDRGKGRVVGGGEKGSSEEVPSREEGGKKSSGRGKREVEREEYD